MTAALLCLASILLFPGNAILHLGILAFGCPGMLKALNGRGVLALSIFAWACFCAVLALNPWTAILGSFCRMEGIVFWLCFLRIAWLYWTNSPSLFPMQSALLAFVALVCILSLATRQPFIERVALGGFCAVAAPFLMSLSPLSLPVMVPLLLASNSRAAVVASAAGCLLFYLLSRNRRERNTALAVLASTLIVLASVLPMTEVGRKFASMDFSRMGLGARSSWLVQAQDISLAHPVFGVGPDNIMFTLKNPVGPMSPTGVPDRTHNLPMDLVLQLGWPGYLASLALLALCIHAVLSKRTARNRAMLASLAGYVVFGMMNPPGAFSHAFAVFCVFGINPNEEDDHDL